MRKLVQPAIDVFDEVILYSKNEKNRLFAASRVLEIEGYAANNRRVASGGSSAPLQINIGVIPWSPGGSAQVVVQQGSTPAQLPSTVQLEPDKKE